MKTVTITAQVEIPESCNWIAKDYTGAVWAYEAKPTYDGHGMWLTPDTASGFPEEWEIEGLELSVDPKHSLQQVREK